jgi:ABC-2 type transport system permease protein
MIGKIIGTSLAGILQFLYGLVVFLYCLPHLCFLELTWADSESFSRINGTGAANLQVPPNVYQELWNLPIASILISFIVYFIGGYFLTALLCSNWCRC